MAQSCSCVMFDNHVHTKECRQTRAKKQVIPVLNGACLLIVGRMQKQSGAEMQSVQTASFHHSKATVRLPVRMPTRAMGQGSPEAASVTGQGRMEAALVTAMGLCQAMALQDRQPKLTKAPVSHKLLSTSVYYSLQPKRATLLQC